MNRPDWQQPNAIASAAADLIADTAACVRFFSRLPLPRLCAADAPERLPDFSKISRAIPLAGLIVALPAALLGLLLGLSTIPPLATAFLVTGALAAVTGALHEDGLGDVIDGFFGGNTREQRLEIMKDSRIGAFGALALIISIGLRASLIAALLTRLGPLPAMLVLLGAESLSRTLIVWQWSVLSPARPEGLGHRFGLPGQSALRQALIIGIVCLVPLVTILTISSLSLALLLAGVAAYATGALAQHKIGGFTGDVLGAIQQTSALAFLLGCLAIP